MTDTKLTFIGHSTVLIESGEIKLITDPIFSNKVLFFKREKELNFDPAGLGDLSAILISHSHYDHLDSPSLNYIKTSTQVIVPEGNEKSICKIIPNPIIELAPWASHSISNGLKIDAVPVKHIGGLSIPKISKKTSGYIIEIGGKKIFFAGDTGYGTHFKDIGNTYNIDVALLPIGGYKPSFIMKRQHLNPLEAVQAFIDLKAKKMIPIHWGTYRLSLETLDEPIEWLRRIINERNLSDKIEILEHGKSLTISDSI